MHEFRILAVCMVGLGAVRAEAQTVVRHFAGNSGTLSAGKPVYRDHPDLTMAANGSQVVSVDGEKVVVSDYAGNVLSSTSLAQFMTNAGATVGKINDPVVDWNEFAGRWVVGCSCSTDFVFVSAGADATGAWSVAQMAGLSGDLTLKLGHDKNGEYIGEYDTSASDPNTGGLGYACFSIPTAEVAWGGAGFAPAHKNQHVCPQESYPATDHDLAKKTTDPHYFLARSFKTGQIQNATNAAYGLIGVQVSWSGTTATYSTDALLSTGFLYNTPITVAQMGGNPIRGTESHRPGYSVNLFQGHLYTTQGSGPCASGCGAQGVDSQQLFFFFDVDVSSFPTMSLAQSVKVSSPSEGYLFSSLAVDGQGNVGIAATGLGSGQFASTLLWSHLATDSAGVLHGPVTAVNGTGAYGCSTGATPTTPGWGTYAKVVQDPADPTKLWTAQEYGSGAGDCVWTTSIIEFSPGPSTATDGGTTGNDAGSGNPDSGGVTPDAGSTGSDSGVSPPPDSGQPPPDAGPSGQGDAGTQMTSGGCGCGAEGRTGAWSVGLALLMLLALTTRRSLSGAGRPSAG